MRDFEQYHGAALIKIINAGSFKIIEKFDKSNSSYLVDKKIGLFIKYSRKRLSPWTFTFDKSHINEITEMHSQLERLFLVLVCGFDGICCLNWNEFCALVSIENQSYPKWVKSSRKKNEKYSVYGIDGGLKNKIGNSDFPNKLKATY